MYNHDNSKLNMYSIRLLQANGHHVKAVIRRTLPAVFKMDHVDFGVFEFSKGAEQAGVRCRCIVGVSPARGGAGIQRTGLYRIVIDMFEPGKIRATESFEWESEMDSFSKGRSKKTSKKPAKKKR